MSAVTNQPQINPHMKFNSPPKGVIEPPLVYSYSLSEELKRAEKDYVELIKNVEKSNLQAFRENHPNLKSNIIGIIKYAVGITALCCGWRYRHSIPILKSICKKPQKTPPSFVDEVRKIWHNITTKKVKN